MVNTFFYNKLGPFADNLKPLVLNLPKKRVSDCEEEAPFDLEVEVLDLPQLDSFERSC